MVITYYGHAYFKLTLGDLTIAVNPPSKASKPARFGADIALITTKLPDYNDADTVTLGDKVPFVIDGPGSYEVRDLLFTGGASTIDIDGKEYINTVYGFTLDGIKIAFLGLATSDKVLSVEAREIATSADMVFVPVGADAGGAYKAATSYGANVIIPYEYDDASLSKFIKEAGQEGKAEAADKATLKRRDLDGKEGFVMVLSPQG